MNIHVHRQGADAEDGRRRGDERVTGGDDLVAGPMSQAFRATSRATVPLVMAWACLTKWAAANSRSNRSTCPTSSENRAVGPRPPP